MTRARNNSQSVRRRTQLYPRDTELRRRRHHRQMSQTSNYFSLDDEMLSTPRSSPASSSSVPTLNSTTPSEMQSDSAPSNQRRASQRVRDQLLNNPDTLLARWNRSQSDIFDDPQSGSTNRVRTDQSDPYTSGTVGGSFGGTIASTASRTTTTRSRSDDGQRHTDARRNNCLRDLAQIQEQLDSVRVLLNAHPSEETRDSLMSAEDGLHDERVTIEAQLQEYLLQAREGDLERDPSILDLMEGGARNAYAGRRFPRGPGNEVQRRNTFTRPGMSTPLSTEGSQEPKHIAAFLYSAKPAPTGSDVWPDIRDRTKVPARYVPLELPNQYGRGGNPRTPVTKRNVRSSTERAWFMRAQFEDVSTNTTWPMNELPSEIYYLIADSLSRDDIKSMRLACKEFEHHISCILFRTVVVPFNTEIYGMLTGLANGRVDVKGKGKAKAVPPSQVEFWKNSKAEDIYSGHAVDVFRSFGSRMKRFGMSFEVDEEVLANPPLKGTREDHKSYWGVYQWPFPEYKRFDQVAGLEDAADETPKMKTAFSLLNQVQELALSLDSGLGWLSGPDRSIRSKVLQEQRPVFGTKHPIPDRRRQAQQALWDYLKEVTPDGTVPELRHTAISSRKMTDSVAAMLAYQEDLIPKPELSMPFIDVHHLESSGSTTQSPMLPIVKDISDWMEIHDIPQASTPGFLSNGEDTNQLAFEGGLIVVKEDNLDPERLDSSPIIPADLSKLQKEWLLETEWAQRAFLSSWLIAIVDNRFTFQNVHTINFARISSRFLLSLSRHDFWTSLPEVENVTLHVIPDYRDVVKDNAGFVETPRISPQVAIWSLQKLVTEMIASRSTIKALNIGWASGGEHAQGLTARNKHLMPAPILPPEWLTTAENLANQELLEERMLKLPHLKSLTLKNCWISPHALVHLVKEHGGLEKLCLESISLTAELFISNGNGQPVPVLAGVAPPPHQQNQGNVVNPAPGFRLQAHHLNAIQQLNQGQQAVQAQGQQNPMHVLLALQNVYNHTAGGLNAPNMAALHHALQPGPVPTGNDWLNPHRMGSWPHVLDAISPGVTLAASGSTSCPVNIPASTPTNKLTTLELKSCGYCRLNNPRLDESAIPVPPYSGYSQYFSRRFNCLSKVMLATKGGIAAEIVQQIPQLEEQALTLGFDLRLGWPEEWAYEVEAPEFDGCVQGGTGRFCGTLNVATRVVVEEEE